MNPTPNPFLPGLRLDLDEQSAKPAAQARRKKCKPEKKKKKKKMKLLAPRSQPRRRRRSAGFWSTATGQIRRDATMTRSGLTERWPRCSVLSMPLHLSEVILNQGKGARGAWWSWNIIPVSTLVDMTGEGNLRTGVPSPIFFRLLLSWCSSLPFPLDPSRDPRGQRSSQNLLSDRPTVSLDQNSILTMGQSFEREGLADSTEQRHGGWHQGERSPCSSYTASPDRTSPALLDLDCRLGIHLELCIRALILNERIWLAVRTGDVVRSSESFEIRDGLSVLDFEKGRFL